MWKDDVINRVGPMYVDDSGLRLGVSPLTEYSPICDDLLHFLSFAFKDFNFAFYLWVSISVLFWLIHLILLSTPLTDSSSPITFLPLDSLSFTLHCLSHTLPLNTLLLQSHGPLYSSQAMLTTYAYPHLNTHLLDRICT